MRPDTLALLDALAPALDAYGKALEAHEHNWSRFYADDTAACVCGWTSPRPSGRKNRRSVGLHIAAAHKRASKAYDVAAAAVIDALP